MRANKATKQHQQQFYKAEKALQSRYTPGETIESAALCNLQALYYHEDLVDSILVLTVDLEIEVIWRKGNGLWEPLQNYVMALFEAIDVCVGIFTQQDPESAYQTYSDMLNRSIIEAPVKQRTKVTQLMMNRDVESYFRYGDMKNWKQYVTQGEKWCHARRHAYLTVERKDSEM